MSSIVCHLVCACCEMPKQSKAERLAAADAERHRENLWCATRYADKIWIEEVFGVIFEASDENQKTLDTLRAVFIRLQRLCNNQSGCVWDSLRRRTLRFIDVAMLVKGEYQVDLAASASATVYDQLFTAVSIQVYPLEECFYGGPKCLYKKGDGSARMSMVRDWAGKGHHPGYILHVLRDYLTLSMNARKLKPTTRYEIGYMMPTWLTLDQLIDLVETRRVAENVKKVSFGPLVIDMAACHALQRQATVYASDFGCVSGSVDILPDNRLCLRYRDYAVGEQNTGDLEIRATEAQWTAFVVATENRLVRKLVKLRDK
jgi:hypothetical protein